MSRQQWRCAIKRGDCGILLENAQAPLQFFQVKQHSKIGMKSALPIAMLFNAI